MSFLTKDDQLRKNEIISKKKAAIVLKKDLIVNQYAKKNI